MEPSDPFNILTETRHGLFLINRHDAYIGRSLDLYGEWSDGELALLWQVLRPGMVVVDAGANIGTHAVPLARAVAPNGFVYAFEPQRIVFQTLVANVAINSLTNVFCQQRALGAQAGLVQVPPLDYATANNFGGVELGGTLDPDTAPTGEPVEVVRIDDFALAACHLIKIDVEGMELAVLRGATDTIKRCQPILYVEADREERRNEILWWLDDHGYTMYWHSVPLYNPGNFKENPEDVFPGTISLNLLALPKSVQQNVDGLERVAVPRRRTLVRRRAAGARLVPVPVRPSVPPLQSARPEHPTPRPAAPPAPLAPPASVHQHDHAPGQTHAPGHSHDQLPPSPATASLPPTVQVLRAALEAAVRHHQAGRLADAAAGYGSVLAVAPDDPDALHLLGLIRRDERRYDDALALIGRAAAVEPTQPLFHFNLGAVHRQLGHLSAAEGSLRQALILAPDSVEARLEFALTLLDGRNLPAAEALLRESAALFPEHAATHFGLAGLLLLDGRYDEGWREYAWRWQLPELVGPQPPATAPRWQGERLAGNTVLLEAEQGHGDTFQFARYIPLVAERGGRVVVRCRPEVQDVLATLPGISTLVAPGEPLPLHDWVASLPDLPRIFGTTLETIPGPVPYLHADPARAAAWAARLAAAAARDSRPPLRVGLVWAGSPDHRLNVQRSAHLLDFAPLADAARIIQATQGRPVHFYSLQTGAPAAEAQTPPPGLDVVDLAPLLTDFAETAALLSLLDLVVTVDTSVGHLAGALGRPAWVLPWATHDWRWLLGRDDSPWYPSVRLFRQEQPNTWGPVLTRVAAALTAWTP